MKLFSTILTTVYKSQNILLAYEHLLYPQLAQVLQPSTLSSEAEPQDGHKSREDAGAPP